MNLKDIFQLDNWRQFTQDNKWTLASVGTTAALVLCYWRSRPKDRLPPGPPGWPIFGNLLDISDSDMHTSCINLGKNYGEIFTLRMGPTTMIVLNSYRVIRDAYVNHGDMFANRPRNWLTHFMPNDIMMSPFDDRWAKKRKMVMAAMRSFGHGSSHGTEEKIQSQVDQFLEYIAPQISEPIEVSDVMPHFSANVICKILYNQVFDMDDPRLSDIINRVRIWYRLQGEYPRLLLFLPVWIGKLFCGHTAGKKMGRATEHCREFIRPFIQEHIETLQEDSPRDFLDMFIINAMGRGHLDVEELANSAFSVMPDGIDTTASVMGWAILYLTLYPDVQRKVQQEIDQVTGGSRKPTHRERSAFPYTVAVVMETLRIVSPVLMSLSHSLKGKDTDFMGYRISKDYHVIANFYGALHEPGIYTDPHAFRPDRFIDGDGILLKQQDTWMPFGIGRRGCIAEPVARMEVFLIVTNLLQIYDFRIPEGMDPPTTDGLDEVIVRSPTPYKVMFVPRNA